MTRREKINMRRERAENKKQEVIRLFVQEKFAHPNMENQQIIVEIIRHVGYSRSRVYDYLGGTTRLITAMATGNYKKEKNYQSIIKE